MQEAQQKQENLKHEMKRIYIEKKSKNSSLRGINKFEEEFSANMYILLQEMIKYIKDEEQKGDVGPVVRKIISKTGSRQNNCMVFSIAKHHLFGDRVKWVDDI